MIAQSNKPVSEYQEADPLEVVGGEAGEQDVAHEEAVRRVAARTDGRLLAGPRCRARRVHRQALTGVQVAAVAQLGHHLGGV